MGIEKSALKVVVAESFVDDIEKRRERSHQNIYRFQGAHQAFRESEELLKKATQQVRNDFVGGKIEIDFSDPLNIGKFIVETMMKTSKKLHDLTNASYQSIIRSEGEVRGLELAAEGIEKLVNGDRARVLAVADGIESGKLTVDENQFYDDGDNGRPTPRVVGKHPGPPMKAKRQAAKKTKGKEEKKTRIRKASLTKKKKDAKNS